MVRRPKQSKANRNFNGIEISPQRLEQNRQAQRAFRQRHRLYVQALEEDVLKLPLLSTQIEVLQSQLITMESRMHALKVENARLREENGRTRVDDLGIRLLEQGEFEIGSTDWSVRLNEDAGCEGDFTMTPCCVATGLLLDSPPLSPISRKLF